MEMFDRVAALTDRKMEFIAGFSKTIHLEGISRAAGTSPFYKGAATTTFSVPLIPLPVVHTISEEDIANGGANLQLGDFVFEIAASAVTEDHLKNANQMVIGKGTSEEKKLEVLQYSIAPWIVSSRTKELAIFNGNVQKWFLYCRGQIDKP